MFMTLASWPDAAYGDQSSMGKCRFGYAIGLMSSTLRGPCHISQWTSKFNRKVVRSISGEEVYAFSAMVDHMPMLRGFYAHFIDPSPGLAGLGDCEGLNPIHPLQEK